MSPHGEFPREIEATLAVVSDRAEAILDRLESMASLAGFALGPGEPLTIRDVYFDTIQRELIRAKWALRLRRIGQDCLITLKGPAAPVHGEGVERFEIEEPWSAEALAGVMAELLRRGVVADAGQAENVEVSSLNSPVIPGFVVVQERETRRMLKRVFATSHDAPFAELALDRVVYHFRDHTILHCEVEIEIMNPSDRDALGAISRSLLKEFGQVLRRWDYGKLATGRAVEDLISSGSLQDVVGQDGYLRKEAFDILENYFAVVVQ